MGIGRTNAIAGGVGASLRVIAPIGVTVTVEKGAKTYTRTANADGVAIFKGLLTGIWKVTISDGVNKPNTRDMLITADYTIIMAFFAAYIPTDYPAGSTCICTKGTQVLTAQDTSGKYTFTVPEAGEWVVSCTDGAQSASKTVTITEDGQSVSVSLNYNTIPEFTYTGDYEMVDDDDNPITTSDGNWKIRFLTSGVFTPTDLRGAADGIDVFLVGGGGGTPGSYTGGAGGGYTNTKRGVLIKKGTSYSITVGAGGTGNATGGSTSAFDAVANGGKPGETSFKGGAGGSGGGGYSGENDTPAGVGGSDGSDGGAGAAVGGKGQGTTTREFAETFGTLYAGGGGGGAVTTNKVGAGGAGGGANGMRDAAANTGGGAGGSIDDNTTSHRGGSGIVIIRNTREVG